MEHSIPHTAHLLLTGSPGCGKTTVITKSVAGRKDSGGFYTVEAREGGERKGFAINTLDGHKGVLASTEIESGIKVGKYGVNTRDIDRIAAASVEEAVRSDSIAVVVIDEIASMEMASARFRRAVITALESGKRVLGTIQARKHPFLEGVRSRPDVSLIEVTGSNRDALPGLVSEWLDHPAGKG
jgi:nucleoside-triphosphatase